MLPGNDHGQVAQVGRAAGKRFLGRARSLQQAVEKFAVFEQLPQQKALQGVALFILNSGVHGLYQSRQIDTGGADVLAGAAVDAVLHQVAGLVAAVQKVGQDQADGSNVDMAVLVSAYHAVDRADIGAGPAAHTTQHLGEVGIAGHPAGPLSRKTMCMIFLPSGAGPQAVAPVIQVT